jgi:hypothetical protein
MAGNKEDASKIDPNNVIEAKYDEVPEEYRKALEAQLKAFEAELKAFEAEYKRQLVSCFGKTQHGVIEKEKFVMPTFPLPTSSTTTTTSVSASPEVTPSVSVSSSGVTFEKIKQLLDERDVHWANWFSSREREAVGKKPEIADDSAPIPNVIISEIPASPTSAAVHMSQPQYGMPMGYFNGQTVTPTNMTGAQYTYTDPIVSVPGSANISRTNELVSHMPQVPPR